MPTTKNVLLVEDCDFIITLAQDAVEDGKGKVKLLVATTLQEVHEILGQNQRIDMVLLDGYIKNGQTTEELPKILKEVRNNCMFVVSTSTCEVMNKTHYDNGADGVIDKGDLYRFLSTYSETAPEGDCVSLELLKYMRY